MEVCDSMHKLKCTEQANIQSDFATSDLSPANP